MSKSLSLYLDPETLGEIEKESKKLKISRTNIIKMWLAKYLEERGKHGSP